MARALYGQKVYRAFVVPECQNISQSGRGKTAMKKKMLALIMVLLLVFAMATFVGCSSSSDADSRGDTTSSTATKVSDDTGDISGEATSAADNTEEEPSSSDVTSDKELQGVCDSIRESIIDNYLTPNNISTEDFSWPSNEDAWHYLTNLIWSYDLGNLEENWFEDEIKESIVFLYEGASSSDLEIMKATMKGILNWANSNPDSDVYDIFYDVLSPPETIIPSNVTFD